MQARRTLDDAGVEMASPKRRRTAWRRGDVSTASSDRAETLRASLRRRVRIAGRCPDAVGPSVRPREAFEVDVAQAEVARHRRR